MARVATQTSFVLGVAMIAMLWTGIALKFKDQAATYHRDALLNSQNLALLFEENVLRSVSEVDKALLFMRRQIEQHPDTADFAAIVSNSDIFNELIFQFAILDAKGVLKASSAGPQPSIPIDLSDRAYFLFHRDNSSDELHISHPVVGRVSKRWSIQLTRRFLDEKGAFGGVVVGSLNPEHFTAFYKSIHLGQSGSISLVGLYGTVRASNGPSGGGRFMLGQDVTGFDCLTSFEATPPIPSLMQRRKATGSSPSAGFAICRSS